MNSALRGIPAAALHTLAESIATGRLGPPFAAIALQRYVPAEICDEVARELQGLSASGLNAKHMAYVLRLLEEERSSVQRLSNRVELVWTGPEVPGSASRDTSIVVRELFSEARSSVLVAGFLVTQGGIIFKALAERMTAVPSLVVRMYLNVASDERAGLTPAETVRAFADSFRNKHWPWPRKPAVYYDPRSLEPDPHTRAILHAKCIVVDRHKSLVTSANFTEAAQARNIEAGVMVEDATLADSLVAQFENLVAAGKLLRLP